MQDVFLILNKKNTFTHHHKTLLRKNNPHNTPITCFTAQDQIVFDSTKISLIPLAAKKSLD
jgi:hypothetical protein